MSAQDTMKSVFLNAVFNAEDEQTISESVTYTPAVGDARQIQAVVHREPSAPHGNVKNKINRIVVANDSTYGIASTEINKGSDRITVADRPGDTPTIHKITNIPKKNGVRLVLEVR